ncbi:MAG: protease modulator HflC [Verrucomicrobiota bacterium]
MNQEKKADRIILWRRLGIGCLIVFLVLASAMTFSVRENEKVVLVRFGKPIRVVEDAGIHWRLPWPIEDARRLDGRTDFLEVRISEALTGDRRNVVLPVFAAWKIDNALTFLKSVGTAESARGKLDAILTSARNSVLGQYHYDQLVSTGEGRVKLAEIEEQIRELADANADRTFGVRIQSVGIKQLTLPESNTAEVFNRMRTERSAARQRYLDEGKKIAGEIRSKAEAERTRILSEAERFAAETKGKAEAEAARTYAQAHGVDPEFYTFLRELQALRHIVDKNTTLVLDMDTAPFRMLKGEALQPQLAGQGRGAEKGNAPFEVEVGKDSRESVPVKSRPVDSSERDFGALFLDNHTPARNPVPGS